MSIVEISIVNFSYLGPSYLARSVVAAHLALYILKILWVIAFVLEVIRSVILCGNFLHNLRNSVFFLNFSKLVSLQEDLSLKFNCMVQFLTTLAIKLRNVFELPRILRNEVIPQDSDLVRRQPCTSTPVITQFFCDGVVFFFLMLTFRSNEYLPHHVDQSADMVLTCFLTEYIHGGLYRDVTLPWLFAVYSFAGSRLILNLRIEAAKNTEVSEYREDNPGRRKIRLKEQTQLMTEEDRAGSWVGRYSSSHRDNADKWVNKGENASEGGNAMRRWSIARGANEDVEDEDGGHIARGDGVAGRCDGCHATEHDHVAAENDDGGDHGIAGDNEGRDDVEQGLKPEVQDLKTGSDSEDSDESGNEESRDKVGLSVIVGIVGEDSERIKKL
ncbi:hypothetical protein BDQ12DRAFT_669849 [Crucibulum laeve]|uniref:Uncharacterized protein n=1 Tax=Crucibulum laeve TaxID=68775 RepID=A0A5C3LMD0_9AGAR|nr:hypothetical protein BDQ12DRAFT_669849 [Crucibulum laeve]